MPGNGNGDGRKAANPRAEDVPWEEVRALAWEARRCRALCFEENAAGYVRNIDGEWITTGYSEARLQTAIDLVRIIKKVGREIGLHRAERFADWVAGHPADKLGQVERTQLKADVRRVEELAINGGYQFMLRRDAASGSE